MHLLFTFSHIRVFPFIHCRYFRKAMYNQRAGLNPNRPAVIDLNVGGHEFQFRIRTNQRVEERGLTSIYLNPDEFSAMEAVIPDSFGLSNEQLQALPRMVRYFKCQDAIETGEICRDNKYTNLDICPDRSGMAAWHPGWKRMALWGNTVALFLSDMLVDSLTELSDSAFNRTELLAQLRKEEDADYEKFESTFEPDFIEYSLVPLDSDLIDAANVSFFFRSPSICHTARLPAETRYLGILTESDQIGVQDYYKGISMEDAKKIVSEGNMKVSTMPLVYDESDRESCDEAEINRDHMDYFLVTSRMGPRTLAIPNKAERQAYVRESQKFQGIVMLCEVPCPWSRCPEGEVQLDSIHNDTLHIEVNGRLVTNVTNFRGCGVLRGEKGHRWQPNDDGQFVLKASIADDDNSTLSFLRIGSFIVL